MLPNWPIFNVADMCINVAAALILVQAFRGIRLDGVAASSGVPTTSPDRPTRDPERRTTAPSRCPTAWPGERVDAAMAQMFGLSRTRAADLIARGLVQVDGAGAAKSDRVLAGATLDVTIPVEADPLDVVPEEVEGIQIIHDDPSIVVISKPVGVAVHPSPGWTGSDRGRATWPRPGSRSPPAAPRSGRGSCSGSTSARRA